ncbi:MAG: hypothetical protein JWM11_2075, partial [Planctomycetaceae bacterium]|nr:hypothetical protein [Planctomycetaceae bacterium]
MLRIVIGSISSGVSVLSRVTGTSQAILLARHGLNNGRFAATADLVAEFYQRLGSTVEEGRFQQQCVGLPLMM